MAKELSKLLTKEQQQEVQIRREQINAFKKALPQLKKAGVLKPGQEEKLRAVDRALKEFE